MDNSKKVWALGGELVSTPAHAKRILINAIKTGKEHLIPQARSVYHQLRRSAA